MFQSTDGKVFGQIPVSYNCNTGVSGCSVRDPDIAKFGSSWYVIHTCPPAAGMGFWCWTKSTDLNIWDNFRKANEGGVVGNYAPNWVHNPDGTPYIDGGGCPHVFHVYQPSGPTYQIAETHPTNCSDFTQAWTAPNILPLPVGEMVSNQLDPYVLCVSPGGGTCTGTGDTFYLWYLELTLSTSEFINYASASSITGTYTLVSPGGNWAGWPGPTQEGPALLKLPDRWRIYFDLVPGTPGNLTGGQIWYSDSFDNWATWTPAISIATQIQAKHGTVIGYP